MSDPARVVICDDFVSLRTMVRLVLELDERIDVVGEAGDGLQAIELAESLRPDIMLLDLSMPRCDGLEALPRIREVSPETRVIVYSGLDKAAMEPRARELGAAAYVEKGISADELVAAVSALAVEVEAAGRSGAA